MEFICTAISSFQGKDGKIVNGHIPTKLKGKWLNTTLGNARKLAESL